MNSQIELEIKNRIESDFKNILENLGTNPFMTRPYITSSMMNVTEELVKKYGSQYKMNYHDFLKIVEPIGDRLRKQYFGF